MVQQKHVGPDSKRVCVLIWVIHWGNSMLSLEACQARGKRLVIHLDWIVHGGALPDAPVVNVPSVHGRGH